jgi:hypothetical protein
VGRIRCAAIWEAMFQARPNVQAKVMAYARSGDEIWGEWEFLGDNLDGTPFWERGVIIVVVDGDVIVQSRFYIEPGGTLNGLPVSRWPGRGGRRPASPWVR